MSVQDKGGSMESKRQLRMKKSRILLLMVFSFSLFLVFSSPLYGKQTPGKYGKAIDSAVLDLEKSKDSKKRLAAAKLLGYHATAKSIKALAAALVSDKDAKVRAKAASSLWRHGKKALAAQQSLTAALQDPSPTVRINSSWALQNQGVGPKKLVEARRSVLEDKNSSVVDNFWAAKGLIDFEPPSVLVLPILQYSKSYLRSKAAESAIKKLARKQDRSIVPDMKDTVNTYHKGNGLILKGLEEFKPKVDGIVSLICLQFSYGDDKLSAIAMVLLEQHTVKAKEVSIWLPYVMDYTVHRDETLRMHAVRLIGRTGGLAYAALPQIVTVMRLDPKPGLRRDAIEVIAKMGDKTKPFPESVKKGVAEKTVVELSKIIKNDPDKQTRLSGVRTMDKLETDPAIVVPVFVYAAVNDDYALVRMSALQALGSLGKSAKAAIPDITPLLKHPDQSTSKNALWAIQAIEKGKTPVDKVLKPASDKGSAEQKKAMTSLRAENASFDERGFMLALNSSDIEKVKAYLDSGVSVNYRFTSMHNKPVLTAALDRTAMYAMQQQATPAKVKEMVKLLLARGADPKLTDKRGNTALMMAAMGCDAELLKILIDGGADPMAKSKDGLTAIEYTISFANKGAASLLVKAGATLSAEKADSYKKAYANNPAALELIEQIPQ